MLNIALLVTLPYALAYGSSNTVFSYILTHFKNKAVSHFTCLCTYPKCNGNINDVRTVYRFL